MELPFPLAKEFWNKVKQDEEKERMPFITTPQRFGRIEGLTQGRLEGIEAILELRFGDAGLQLMPELRAIDNEDQLEAILRAAKTAASPDELRKLWTEMPAR